MIPFAKHFFAQAADVCRRLNYDDIDRLTRELVALRERGGRLFLLGVGGSAANCSHAVNDFRKLAGIEAYAPTDNVSELTARTNDEGWDTVFSAWLRVSRAGERDAILVFSVGGGDLERNVSPNLVKAVDEARARRMRILGVVGRDGGYTGKHADAVVIVPTIDAALVTPYAEAFQALIWHCVVSHPALAQTQTKWEATVSAEA